MGGSRWKRRTRGDLPPHRQVAELLAHFRRRLEALEKLQKEVAAAEGVRPDLRLKAGRLLEKFGAEVQELHRGIKEVSLLLAVFDEMGKDLAKQFDAKGPEDPSGSK